MSKRVFIKATTIGRDISALDVYHTSITASNLLESNVLKADLISGSYYVVDDNVTEFIAVCNDEGECQDQSGSLTIAEYNLNIRYFDIHSTDSEATVQIVYPIADGPAIGTLTQEVDFRTYPSFIIQADASSAYPRLSGFAGWYDAPTSGNLLSTDNPLTITVNSFTGSRGDSFYAVFS